MDIDRYESYLKSEEKSKATIEKYIHDVKVFLNWLGDHAIKRELVIKYKDVLKTKYEASSVNTILSSINSYFDWIGHPEYKVKNIKIQKDNFIDPKRELTKEEYERLLKTAYDMGKHRIYYIMQTICSCGLRVSELEFITAEAVRRGIAYVTNKSKKRNVYIPDALAALLKPYITMRNIKKGPVFVTRTGRPLDRSNIWTEMKKLCEKAGVLASKVFPHSLRHLFARTYYMIHQDVVRLADILGHSSVNTTRIYTAESGEIHFKRIRVLELVFDFKNRNTT